MRRIKGDALDAVSRALGLSGRGSPVTELTDGIVDQVLVVNEIIRRGRTLALGQGIFTAVMQNNHAVANTQTSTADPYNIGPVATVAPFPAVIPPAFDLWLLTASVMRESGGGTIQASLTAEYADSAQGWGVNQAGAAVVMNDQHALAYWDSIVGTSHVLALANGGSPWQRLGIRLPRNDATRLRFSTVSSAAAVYTLQLVFGLFPISLGQDGII